MNALLSNLAGSIAGLLARPLTKGAVRILMYHRFGADGATRVTTTSEFEQQLRYIRRYFKPRALSDVVRDLETGTQPDPGTVVLTVDDGYRDFADYAYPLLRRHRVPATVYLATNFVDGHHWLWFDALRWLVDHASDGRRRIELEQESIDATLDTPASRMKLWLTICGMMSGLGPEAQADVMSRTQGCLGIKLPDRPTDAYQALSWNDARLMDPAVVEFGAHTCTHPILSRCSIGRQKQEIAQSRIAIESELQREARAFCYPNGQQEDFTPETVELVREAGYSSAVKAFGGFQTARKDLWQLNRVGTPEDFRMFKNCINGVWHLRDRVW